MPPQHQVHNQINQNKPQTILFIVRENEPVDRWSSQAPGFISICNEKYMNLLLHSRGERLQHLLQIRRGLQTFLEIGKGPCFKEGRGAIGSWGKSSRLGASERIVWQAQLSQGAEKETEWAQSWRPALQKCCQVGHYRHQLALKIVFPSALPIFSISDRHFSQRNGSLGWQNKQKHWEDLAKNAHPRRSESSLNWIWASGLCVVAIPSSLQTHSKSTSAANKVVSAFCWFLPGKNICSCSELS